MPRLLLLLALLAGGLGAAETLTVSFKTSPAGGSYAPKHVVAVWVETASGSFVKTIGDWSRSRRSNLKQWRAKAGTSDTDAVMGATITSHSNALTVTWNMTRRGGTAAGDGAYKVWFETVDKNSPATGTGSVSGANRFSFAFTKDGKPASGNATDPRGKYTAVHWTYTGRAPAITAQPQDLAVAVGDPASFSITATGATAYQWRRDGSAISGATARTYTLASAALADDGTVFTCLAKNAAGQTVSDPATLTVAGLPEAPAITRQPAGRSVLEGQTATFSITATGVPTPTYQWKRDGVAIAGATVRTYTTPATTLADSGASFTCTVRNSAGTVTSNPATLTVNAAPPVITVQPADRTVAAGQTATFSVTATGTAPLRYQWRLDGVAIAGATRRTYTTPPTVLADDGSRFTCRISNAAGVVSSAIGLLSVRSATAGTAYIAFTSSPAGGSYAPKHVLAAWIETAAGAFVKTVGDWSASRRDNLSQWQARSGGNDTDAVMGATRLSHSPVANLAWDLTARDSDVAVADGAYVLCLEVVDANNPAAGTASVAGARRTRVPFSIAGGAVQAVGPLAQDGFSNVSVTPDTTVAPPSTGSATAGGDANCGNGGIYALLGASLLFIGLRRRRVASCRGGA